MPHKKFSSTIKKILPAKSYKLLRLFLSNLRKDGISFENVEYRKTQKKEKSKFLKKRLAISNCVCYYTEALMKALYAPVAQLDRVTGYEPVGRGFESLPAYQKSS